jgi:hypothetical protein
VLCEGLGDRQADNFLILIPEQPTWVPSATAREASVALLRQALPLADDVSGQLTEDVRFVDCGANFENVRCPRCGSDLGEWWTLAMEAAHEHKFRDLRATMPCCAARLSLNDLAYSWPMGFARFTLEAINPTIGVELPARLQRRLEAVLGCRLRVIWKDV